jgi:hypothetical protein
MKNLIVAAVVSAFSLGAVAASHMEKGASAPMAKPMAAPMAAGPASAPAKKVMKAKKVKKAASAA